MTFCTLWSVCMYRDTEREREQMMRNFSIIKVRFHIKMFVFLLLCFLLAGATNSAPTAPPQAEPEAAGRQNSTSTEYIRKCCKATLYPGVCYASLARYADVVQQSDARLANVAANVTHCRLRSLSGLVERLLARNATVMERAALPDCYEVLGDAADWARQAAEQLLGLDNMAGPGVAWRVSNALTWMSAALTDEDTCTEGFAKMAAPGTAQGDIYCRVRKVEKYTGNALALIHILGFS